MKISTKVQYATRALLDIALNQNGEPVLLKDIAERQLMPLSYLEHIISPLAGAGIIRSIRGPRGGVSLAKPPEDIKLGEIMRALEGPLSLVKCLKSSEECSRSGVCAAQGTWSDLQKTIGDVMESVTLKDLVKRQEEMARKPSPMYYI